MPDPCLASDLEVPELPCAGVTPEVTAEMLIMYSSLDFLPSKPQSKLEVVKQEMARVNVDILEISELKWTRMGEFNSDD